MDSNSTSKSFIKTILNYSKSKDITWGLSEEIETKICNNKDLNSFVGFLLNQTDQISEENANQFFEIAKKEAVNYFDVDELLKALTEAGFSHTNIEVALYTKTALTLHTKFMVLSKGASQLSEMAQIFQAQENIGEFIEIKNTFVTDWFNQFKSDPLKSLTINHLKYPNAFSVIGRFLQNALSSEMHNDTKETMQNAYKNEGHAAAAETMWWHFLEEIANSEDAGSRFAKEKEILAVLEEKLYSQEKLLTLFEKDDTLVQTMLNENSLKQLIKDNITKEDVRVRRYIDVFLTVKYEKLLASASDTTQQPSEETPEAGPSTPRPSLG